MAIRFTSYEWYKQMLADSAGNVTSKSTFMGEFTSLLGTGRIYLQHAHGRHAGDQGFSIPEDLVLT
jgi:hypothetical protein